MADEIEQCVCGGVAVMAAHGSVHYVRCSRVDVYDPVCWWGPVRKTESSAIVAWNRVMKAVKEANDGR